ncbi:THUMP-like domain-containing protein [Lacinutrix salivirga]
MIKLDDFILSPEKQEFINNNLNSDITQLLLKGIPFTSTETKAIIEQIEAKNKSKKKLPTWFSAKHIYYPNKLNIEQTSSEITAKFKANLVSGKSLIDLTGGFGVDSFYFSKHIEKVTHCEINPTLSKIVAHNFKQLNISNITCIASDGIEALKTINTPFDWLYIDPSRRDDSKEKVFLLKDCLPNVPKYLGLFFKYAEHILIKTSPLLDISAAINELSNVKTIYSVAVNNDVKELLFELQRDYNESITIKTVNIKKETEEHFEFQLHEESSNQPDFSKPLTYLYEPNAAILKTGAFNTIATKLNIYKLHKHSHLYTSDTLIEFPGRRFKIEKVAEYNKKRFKREFNIEKANVTTRNFPETVSQIRKKLSLKDGSDTYLFFTRDINNITIVISTKKAKK